MNTEKHYCKKCNKLCGIVNKENQKPLAFYKPYEKTLNHIICLECKK
jgi:hypothetical protein